LVGTKNKKDLLKSTIVEKLRFSSKRIGFVFLRPFSLLDVRLYASRSEERTILPKIPSALLLALYIALAMNALWHF